MNPPQHALPPSRAEIVEWFGLSFGLILPGLATETYEHTERFAGPLGFVLILRGFTIGWHQFRWTILETAGGLVGRAVTPLSYYFIGTRFGYRLVLDTRERHQLEAGLGVGGGQAWFFCGERCNESFNGEEGSLALSPMLQYRYQTAG